MPLSYVSHAAAPPETDLAFRVFNVGLPKTGTTSIARLFSRYRSGHEFWFEETVTMIRNHARGLRSDADRRRFVLQRCDRGKLDVDSASFNHFYVDVLVEAFPNARFIATLRDCYSWIESVLNMCLRYLKSGSMQPWLRAYANFIFGTTDQPVRFASGKEFVSHLPRILEGLIRHWTAANTRMLDALPTDRAVLVRTYDLSEAAPALAAFLDVPAESLIQERAHSNAAPDRISWYDHVDLPLLNDRIRHTAGPLMDRLFPGFTLEDHRAGRPYPHAPRLSEALAACVAAPSP